MDSIRKLLRIASRRLAWSRALEGLSWGLVTAFGICVLVVAGSKFIPSMTVPWTAVASGLVIALVITSVVFARFSQVDERSVALEADARLGLDERLISAIALEASTDPFARAAIDDAHRAAMKPELSSKIRATFPIVLPARGWYALPAIALCFALDHWIPAYPWSAPVEVAIEPAAIQVATIESRAAVEKVIAEIKDNEALNKELEEKFGDLAKVGDAAKELANPTSPEDARRDAIRRMSDLADKLDAVRTGEKAQLAESLKQDLKSLDAKEQTEGKELADALAKGDFSEAKQKLDELAKKALEGALSEAEAASLEKDLNELAKQLEALADRQQALQDQLSKAGLDPQLAKNPAALAEAIKNSPGLSAQQRAALEKQVASSTAAQKVLKQLAQSSQQAASQCKSGAQNSGQPSGQQQGGAGQQGQQGQQGAPSGEGEDSGLGSGMSDQLSELEQMQSMLEQAESAANACERGCQGQGNGLGQSPSKAQANSDSRSVMGPDQIREGGRGQASGGKTPTAKTPSGTKSQKEKTQTTKGDIIARQLVENPNPEVGVSSTTLENIAEEVADAAEGAVLEVDVPAHLRDAHKRYFGRMKQELDAKGVKVPPASTPPAPSGNAKP